jgi:hypothetical protein
LIGSRPKINSMDVQPTVKIDTSPIKRVKCAKVLGVEIHENLNLEKHIEYIARKVSSGIGALKKLCRPRYISAGVQCIDPAAF